MKVTPMRQPHPSKSGADERMKLHALENELRRLKVKYERSQRSLESLQNILPDLPVAFIVVGSDGAIVYANKAVKALLNTEEIEGKPYGDVLYDDTQREQDCPIRRAIQGAGTEKGTVSLAAGAPRHIAVRPVQLSDGRRAVIAALLQERSEERATIETTLHMEKLSALGELISGIAHELNNPLTGVIGFSELLAQRNLDTKTEEMVGKVLAEANRCKRIVANLLSFSRKHPYQRGRVEVNELVESALQLLRYELRLADINVKIHVNAGLPPTIGDPYLLQQVFFNVIHNALQAMKKRPAENVLTINTESSSGSILVRISDTGPGIPTDLVGRIFDPFFTTKSAEKGTGLGLSISHKIISKHGGTMTVESQPGQGATFIVELPVIRPATETAPGSHVAVVEEERRGKILIIDDEQAILDLVAEILKSKAHEVTATQKASEALRVMTDTQYDCIISDIKMPEIDGREFYELVKALRPDMAQKLIFMTGDYLNDGTAKFVRDSGIPYLKKPFSSDEIIEVTNKVLAGNLPAPPEPRPKPN